MPRIPRARACPGGLVYHVINRGNERRTIFHKPGDAQLFIDLLRETKRHVLGVGLLAFCLMPNHWHLVLFPRRDGQLSAFMSWLTNTHVRRYRRHYQDEGTGHVYQSRFKSFAIQDDLHLLRVLRYVEANPVRAGLVPHAADWRWSSLRLRHNGNPAHLLDDWPVDRPPDWETLVDSQLPQPDVQELRTCVQRGRPFGDQSWVAQTAARLGLTPALRPRGRPKKTPEKGDIHYLST